MIRAIIFDCFGVLATDIWLAFCESLPPSADRARASDLNKAFDRGMITHQEFIDGVREVTGQEPPDIEQLSAGQLGKNEALLEYIRELKPQYKIGMISNISSDWITDELLTPEDQLLFDDMVFSHKVGLTKPDPRIFALACERLGVPMETAVMIDDREGYVSAAKDCGMSGIVYTNLADFKLELQKLLDTDHEALLAK